MPDRPSPPARRVRLIGRGAEAESIRERVVHGTGRLVTLTGVGGAGKTTLALEVARALVPTQADGVAFVDLTDVNDADGVVAACSRSLGLAEQERSPLAVLIDHLAPRHLLLVLDGCEQEVGEVGRLVDSLLDDCPDLRVLATSRIPLRVRGESVIVVPPMPVPDGDDEADAATLASVPSAELFLERATAARADLTLADWVGPVASICRRLDGVPLAIELAAAQTAALTPAQIDHRLSGDGRSARTGDAAGGPQTVEATLDWSHRLLDEDERAVYRRLAVFAGGWTLETAQRVCAREAEPIDVGAALVALVESSLVIRDAEGTRFRMLAPVRDHAAGELVSSGEHEEVARRHAACHLALVSTREADWRVIWPEHLDVIAAEHQNCLAALRFAESSGLAPLVLGLDTSLLLFWRIRGLLRTGRRRLDAALEVVGEEPTRERGLVLAGLTHYGQLLGDADAAEERGREAQRILATAGDVVGLRTVIGFLGDLASDRGDFDRAAELYEQARALTEGEDSDLDLGFWHANIGRLAARRGDHDTAERELDAARTRLAGSPGWYQAHVLVQLGALARQRGDLDRAGGLLAEALGYLRAYGASVEAIGCLQEVAGVMVDRRDPYAASVLFAAATRLRDRTGLAVGAADATRLVRDVERARARLASADFAEAWSRGRQLSLERAAALVADPGEARRRAPRSERGATLTPRERDVAALVAEGMSNAQIGEVLAIAQGTARIHVERILGKLGLTSRVQIATWVVRNPEELRRDPPSQSDVSAG